MAFNENTRVKIPAILQILIKTIAEMTADAVSPEHMKRLSNHLENWDNTYTLLNHLHRQNPSIIDKGQPFFCKTNNCS